MLLVKKIVYTHLSDDISQNRDSLIENLFLVTQNEARSKDWKDFTVIHPSGSTGLSVTNTRHTAWLLPSSEQYLAPAQRSDLSFHTFPQDKAFPRVSLMAQNSKVNISLSHASQKHWNRKQIKTVRGIVFQLLLYSST